MYFGRLFLPCAPLFSNGGEVSSVWTRQYARRRREKNWAFLLWGSRQARPSEYGNRSIYSKKYRPYYRCTVCNTTILYCIFVCYIRASARSKKCFSAIVIQNLETFPRCGHQCLEKVEDGLRTLFTSEVVNTFLFLTCISRAWRVLPCWYNSYGI